MVSQKSADHTHCSCILARSSTCIRLDRTISHFPRCSAGHPLGIVFGPLKTMAGRSSGCVRCPQKWQTIRTLALFPCMVSQKSADHTHCSCILARSSTCIRLDRTISHFPRCSAGHPLGIVFGPLKTMAGRSSGCVRCPQKWQTIRTLALFPCMVSQKSADHPHYPWSRPSQHLHSNRPYALPVVQPAPTPCIQILFSSCAASLYVIPQIRATWWASEEKRKRTWRANSTFSSSDRSSKRS